VTLWRRIGIVLLRTVVALVVLRLVATATVAGAAARAITVAHCVSLRCEWARCGNAVIVGVMRKVLEGEVRLSGGCLFSSRAVRNDAGAIAKSRGSRASATREGALASVGFLAGRLG
jgi:hypothetical protein